MFQTGTRILQSLELASPISWELAHRDLFDPNNQLFRTNNLFTTILIGSESYGGLKELAHENGSDGTVRVSTANLNAKSFSLVFEPSKAISLRENMPQYDPIAFGVLYGYNHGNIVNPTTKPREDASDLGTLILDGLNIDASGAYQDHIGLLQKLTQTTFQKGQAKGNPLNERYHEYQNATVRVHDQFREMIPDYFLEFFQEKDDSADRVMRDVRKEILEKVHCYSGDASYRSFFFDITDLKDKVLSKGGELDLSIAVAAKSERIFYNNPQGHIVAAGAKDNTFLVPNATLFLDIQVDRLQSDEVFRLKKF